MPGRGGKNHLAARRAFRIEFPGKKGIELALFENLHWGTKAMSAILKVVTYFQSDRRAMTALEYAMIAGVVGAAVAVGFGTLATDMTAKLNAIGGSV